MTKYKIINNGSLFFVIATMVVAFTLGCSETRNTAPTTITYNGAHRDLGRGSAYAFTSLDSSRPEIEFFGN